MVMSTSAYAFVSKGSSISRIRRIRLINTIEIIPVRITPPYGKSIFVNSSNKSSDPTESSAIEYAAGMKVVSFIV